MGYPEHFRNKYLNPLSENQKVRRAKVSFKEAQQLGGVNRDGSHTDLAILETIPLTQPEAPFPACFLSPLLHFPEDRVNSSTHSLCRCSSFVLTPEHSVNGKKVSKRGTIYFIILNILKIYHYLFIVIYSNRNIFRYLNLKK